MRSPVAPMNSLRSRLFRVNGSSITFESAANNRMTLTAAAIRSISSSSSSFNQSLLINSSPSQQSTYAHNHQSSTTTRHHLMQRRNYAADGKVAKTGQKRVDKKADDEGDALPPFYPKPALESLPNVGLAKPESIDMPHDPRHSYPNHKLLRKIDYELRLRHDFDNRSELFSKSSQKKVVEPGSVLLVEHISSRSSPRRSLFAGVLLAVQRKGIMSTFTLRNYVLGAGVEMVFPVYSPMVTKIKVLKRVEGFAKGKDNVCGLRTRPTLAPLSFTKIEEMLNRENEILRKEVMAQKK